MSTSNALPHAMGHQINYNNAALLLPFRRRTKYLTELQHLYYQLHHQNQQRSNNHPAIISLLSSSTQAITLMAQHPHQWLITSLPNITSRRFFALSQSTHFQGAESIRARTGPGLTARKSTPHHRHLLNSALSSWIHTCFSLYYAGGTGDSC
jgi:hypothetical protein